MGLESGARGAPTSAGREPQHLPGPPLEAAARGEEVGPREGRTAGALQPGAAGVGRQHEGAAPQDGEGETREERETEGRKRSCCGKREKKECDQAGIRGRKRIKRHRKKIRVRDSYMRYFN